MLTVSQPEGLMLPMTGPTAFYTHLQQEGGHNPQETLLKHGAQVIWEIVPLSPTRYLHHKAIIISLKIIADVLNTQRQNGKTKNMPQIKKRERERERKRERNHQQKN